MQLHHIVSGEELCFNVTKLLTPPELLFRICATCSSRPFSWDAPSMPWQMPYHLPALYYCMTFTAPIPLLSSAGRSAGQATGGSEVEELSQGFNRQSWTAARAFLEKHRWPSSQPRTFNDHGPRAVMHPNAPLQLKSKLSAVEKNTSRDAVPQQISRCLLHI